MYIILQGLVNAYTYHCNSYGGPHKKRFDILLTYVFRFVYKTKNRNNISLVVFLKIRHIGYSIPNIFLNLILFSLHAVISVQALRK